MKPLRLLPIALALTVLACKPSAPTQEAAPAATPVPDATPADAPARARLDPPKPEHWQCGDQAISTRFQDAALEVMTLMMSGRQVPLRAAPAEDGARFADASGNEFRSRPGDVTLSIVGRTPVPCRKVDTPSPWTAAVLSGQAWRAAGNEPGWHVEVGPGDTPAIAGQILASGTVDKWTIARAQRVPADEITWQGTASNGAPVTLMIERSSCVDSMSGEEFEATGTLTVGRATYRGCAASLQD